MTTRNIPHDQWREELDSFSRQHEGWIVTVKVDDPNGASRTEAHELPLRGVSVDSPAQGIAVMVGRSASDHLTHEVPRPIEVGIDRTESGAERALRIRADDGSTTTVEFRSPRRPEDVDGLPRSRE